MLKLERLFDGIYSCDIEFDSYVPVDLKINYTFKLQMSTVKKKEEESNIFCIFIGTHKSILELYVESDTGRIVSVTLVHVDKCKRRLGTIERSSSAVVINKIPGIGVDVKTEKGNGFWVYVNYENDFEVILDEIGLLIVFQEMKADRVVTQMNDFAVVFDERLGLSKIFIKFSDKYAFAFLKKVLELA